MNAHETYRMDYDQDDAAEDAYRAKIAQRSARAIRNADRDQADARPNLEASYFAACGIAR